MDRLERAFLPIIYTGLALFVLIAVGSVVFDRKPDVALLGALGTLMGATITGMVAARDRARAREVPEALPEGANGGTDADPR